MAEVAVTISATNEEVAQILLQSGVVAIEVEKSYDLVSGIKSPIYLDNRRLLSKPHSRVIIVEYFVSRILNTIGKGNFDVIAGTATAGIPWAAWIAHELNVPLIYVRPEPKERGMRRQVEGILNPGQRVVIIEDLITTGISISNVADAIREAGGEISDCLSIFTFGTRAGRARLQEKNISLWSLTNLETLIKVAKADKLLDDKQTEMLVQFFDSI